MLQVKLRDEMEVALKESLREAERAANRIVKGEGESGSIPGAFKAVSFSPQLTQTGGSQLSCWSCLVFVHIALSFPHPHTLRGGGGTLTPCPSLRVTILLNSSPAAARS